MFMRTWDYRGFLIEAILALLEHIFDPKIWDFFMKMIFSENMDFQLSKDVTTILKKFLEQILWFDVVWSKMAKSAVFAFFCQKSSSYLGT